MKGWRKEDSAAGGENKKMRTARKSLLVDCKNPASPFFKGEFVRTFLPSCPPHSYKLAARLPRGQRRPLQWWRRYSGVTAEP